MQNFAKTVENGKDLRVRLGQPELFELPHVSEVAGGKSLPTVFLMIKENCPS
jgi:hypothetical protein